MTNVTVTEKPNDLTKVEQTFLPDSPGRQQSRTRLGGERSSNQGAGSEQRSYSTFALQLGAHESHFRFASGTLRYFSASL